MLSELLSDPRISRAVKQTFGQLPLLEVTDGYWERAGPDFQHFVDVAGLRLFGGRPRRRAT